MPVPLTLKVFKGDTLVTAKDFERDIIKIGRLASAHLCLEDEKVSRIHSVIEVAADGSLSIIDMGSVEGTYVNGKRVNKGQLSFGDEIKVGGTTIRLENPAAVAAVNLATAAASTAPTPAPVAPVPETPLAVGLSQAAVSPAAAAAVTPAPVPVVVQQPVAAAPAPKAAAQPVAAPVEHAPAEPAPRVRRIARKGNGPLGLGLHFMWGDQRVGDFFLAPGQKRSFSVGSAKGVDFIMGDAKLGGERFEVVRTDGQGFTVLFTGKMKGELTRKGDTSDLKAVIESGKATHEGEAYALTLKEDDFLWVDLGGVTLEAVFEPVPKRAIAALGESMDFAVINIFLVMFFLASMFVIAAANHAAAGDEFADELAGNNSRLAKLIVKPPETQKNKFLEKLNQQKAEKQAEKAKAAKKEDSGKKEVVKQNQPASNAKPDKKAAAKNMAAKIFGGKGGASSLFGGGGLGGDLKSAMGGLVGKGSMVGGLGGLGLKGGGGGGGGGGDVIGIGAVGTKGRGGGMGGYGSGVGGLGGKQSVDVGIAAEDATVSGSLDKELIRQVIQRNKSQIKYCYESLLNRFPKLGGKVSVRFIIAAEGNVISSSVAQSTAGNPELEQCVAGRVRTWAFPKPKGGGSVTVTYPFIFKAAGE
ncbi:MAG TPA: adventurous gliding motility protein GltG [Archangium sp.]|uniref:adventurous gliding motility protein GltG n=1 Tax=Archangium sp. TaxID=1872627 RepID=UPI002E37C2FF|nr:adventurous gliding motility protein GltG [Archangium sp.]HEX5749756.1 adventurous gliding motility protein GltG [Archangium sp.]